VAAASLLLRPNPNQERLLSTRKHPKRALHSGERSETQLQQQPRNGEKQQ
jgi:hypothetical protein